VILGTAVGDALGLPREELSRQRARKLFGKAPLRHRFLFGRGMVSDDTEHTCMVGQALLTAPDDVDAFARALAWRLRFWLLGLPAGTGWATLRAIVRLWLGFSPSYSGVWSAGNGPAMRAAILGICLGGDQDRLRRYIRASTRLTHCDPRAERGALLVAQAAHFGAMAGPHGVSPENFLRNVAEVPEIDDELQRLLDKIGAHLQRNAPALELANVLGLERGVSGYVYHTVPMALYGWLRHPNDFRGAVEEVIELGGDTDSTGAIVGGITGATVGVRGIPREWIDGLIEWPRSEAWMHLLAERLAGQFTLAGAAAGDGPLPLCWPALIPRNLLFLAVVLFHGFRRLLPPY
jgi:ADP-ribosylglycohydrolase